MKNALKAVFAASVSLAAIMAVNTTASANNFCDSKVASYRGELDSKVNSAVAELDAGIAQIRSGGGDPDKIALKMGDGSFKTLPELRATVLSQKAEVSGQIDKAASDCASDLKPFQDGTDGIVTIATGGLNLLLPERMTHIEIGEILAGKPFGGENAIIPQFREQILSGLGLKHDNGFVVQLIRDPLHAIFH